MMAGGVNVEHALWPAWLNDRRRDDPTGRREPRTSHLRPGDTLPAGAGACCHCEWTTYVPDDPAELARQAIAHRIDSGGHPAVWRTGDEAEAS